MRMEENEEKERKEEVRERLREKTQLHSLIKLDEATPDTINAEGNTGRAVWNI
jgi:hypothetical protein